MVGGELEYKVEEILDSRVHWRKLEYLIKWKGYPLEERSWEPEDALTNAPQVVKRFHQEHPSAPSRMDIHTLTFVPYENFTEPAVPALPWEMGRVRRVDAQ